MFCLKYGHKKRFDPDLPYFNAIDALIYLEIHARLDSLSTPTIRH